MTGRHSERVRWVLVVAFSAGMAWVEAACVYYLRVMVDRVEPYQPDPLPIRGILGQVELVREGATLLMLATTGLLAGRTWRARLSYAGIAFGVWDILYTSSCASSVVGPRPCSTGTFSFCCRCRGGGRCSHPSLSRH